MNDLFQTIAEVRALTPEIRDRIRDSCGTRGIKALAALDGQKVKQYNDFLVVEGATADYIVDEGFCTCGDFLFRERECWHLLAARLALAAGLVVPAEGWFQDRWKENRATED